MNLTEYIQSFPKPERAKAKKKLSRGVGVSESAVKHWCNRTRKIDPLNVLALEKITNGLLTRYELRPDIYPRPAEKISRKH